MIIDPADADADARKCASRTGPSPVHVWKYYRALVKNMPGVTRDLFGALTIL
jgi:hypothetical protein